MKINAIDDVMGPGDKKAAVLETTLVQVLIIKRRGISVFVPRTD